MATLVLLNARTFAAGADLTGRSSKVELTAEVDEKATTNYGDAGWATLVGGLFSTSISGGGQWEAGDPGRVDDAAWAAMTGRASIPWTFCPESASVGDLAWHTTALTKSYKVGGQIGDVAPWEAQASGSAPLLRGVVAHPPGTARTATGAGTALNLGALSADQRLYVNLHVVSVAGTAGPTITARVESAPDNTFAAATTRATFAAAGARSGQAVAVAGAVTDSWWRIAWTITGTTPSFLFVASVGRA